MPFSSYAYSQTLPIDRGTNAKGLGGESKADAHGRQVKKALYKVQDLDLEDSDFEPILKDLMSKFRKHIKGEEKDDLAALENTLPASET
jgi:hypothetical protein